MWVFTEWRSWHRQRSIRRSCVRRRLRIEQRSLRYRRITDTNCRAPWTVLDHKCGLRILQMEKMSVRRWRKRRKGERNVVSTWRNPWRSEDKKGENRRIRERAGEVWENVGAVSFPATSVWVGGMHLQPYTWSLASFGGPSCNLGKKTETAEKDVGSLG